MTINDATPYPMEDPEQLGLAFGEVFDLVDETVEGVTDAEVEQRLRQLLADTATPGEAVDLNDLDRVLRGPSWNVSHRLDPTTLAGMTGQAAWDEAHCALQVAREQLVVARAAADAARREAAEQRAAAAAAQRQAEEVTAGVNAYVDEALDRADNVLADARAEAARLVAEAEQQAREILAAARARAVPAEVTPVMQAWSKGRCLVVSGSAGSGKTAFFATALNALLSEPTASHEPPVPARPDFSSAYAQFQRQLAQVRRQLAAIEPLTPLPAVHPAALSGHIARNEMQHVRRLLTYQAGAASSLTGTPVEAHRSELGAGSNPSDHLGDTLRAIRGEVIPQLTGSFRRAVHLYYPHDLVVDLCVVLNRSSVPLVPHDGGPRDDAQREGLYALMRSSGSCPSVSTFDVDSDGEDRPSDVGEINQSGAGQRHVVQVKDCSFTEGKWFSEPIPNPPLVVLWTCSDSANLPQPAPRDRDSDELASATLTGEDSVPAKK
ncbi:hypothetical protein ACFYPF_26310 [Micromonospora sp. NPDC005223]|uniref:hypothetical protein n=1 Tax=Micromonospora sp. NPDC005223 TaxID=3364227 RepID=UPI0036C0F315